MRRSQRLLAALGVLAISFVMPPPASAQRYRASCPACQPIVNQLEELERQWDEAQRNYYRELGAAMQLQRANINDQGVLAGAKVEFSPEAVAKLEKETQARAAAREPQIEKHQDNASHYSRLASSLRLEIVRLRVDLEACNLRCNTPGATPDPPVGTGTSNPPVTADPPAPVPPAPSDCPACRELAERLNNLRQQRAAAQRTRDGIPVTRKAVIADRAERQAELNKLRSRPANQRNLDEELSVEDRVEAAGEQLKQLDEYEKFWDGEVKRLDAEIAPIEKELERCNEMCPTDTRTGSLFNRRTMLIAGGAVLGAVAVVNGGGNSQPAVITAPAAVSIPAPPVSTAPTPAPAPAPVPTPAPTPPPVIDGDYFCQACIVAEDILFHNPNIRLCEAILFLFGVRQGSIAITHPAPFVPITGDFNTSTGAFTATGRGTVAGFSNVGVRGQGTADAASGRITFDYTMGTGGELPGGRPIVYRLTLQRR